MPLYEYECEACGHHLEAQQRLADAPLTQCPECGKKKLQKLISATAFHLKGGGWYKDLYSSQKPESSDSKAEAKSTDAKPESTSAATPTESKAEAKSTDAKAESKSDKKKGGGGSSGTGGSGGSGGAKKPSKGGSSASASI